MLFCLTSLSLTNMDVLLRVLLSLSTLAGQSAVISFCELVISDNNGLSNQHKTLWIFKWNCTLCGYMCSKMLYLLLLQEFTAYLQSVKCQWELEVRSPSHVSMSQSTKTMWNTCVKDLLGTPALTRLKQTNKIIKGFPSLMTKY